MADRQWNELKPGSGWVQQWRELEPGATGHSFKAELYYNNQTRGLLFACKDADGNISDEVLAEVMFEV